jgi:hypothetical protein
VEKLTVIATAVLVVALRPSNEPASFKEVAEQGRTIVMAQCRADGREMITCAVIEAWRGKKPDDAILISRRDWSRFAAGTIEGRPEARVLVVVEPIADVGCALIPADSGLELRVLGNVGTCVIPIMDGYLPKEFRPRYDRAKGPRLSVERLKAELLAPTRVPFLILARHSECADGRNQLFVIDEKLVFWERVGSCPDNSYGATLYGSTVDDVLCHVGNTIAGTIRSCPAPDYEDIFEIIIRHSDRPDLGLGTGHTVQKLSF